MLQKRMIRNESHFLFIYLLMTKEGRKILLVRSIQNRKMNVVSETERFREALLEHVKYYVYLCFKVDKCFSFIA